MYARVATFEGGDPAEVKETLAGIRERAASGPPEGVPAKGFLMLAAPDGGKVLAIGLFETEADMRQGDQVLNEMSPPVPGGLGQRSSVDLMEVAVQESS